MKRRFLLKSGALTCFAAGSMPMSAVKALEANSAYKNKVVVTVYQRFGMDGLMAVTPYESKSLAKLRPDFMLGAPGSDRADARIDLGEGYGLHSAFAPMAHLYEKGHLAIVHGAGSPDNTRSHLQAAHWWESGTPGDHSHRDGWMNRALSVVEDRSAMSAVSVTANKPRIFYGNNPTVTTGGVAELSLDMSDHSEFADMSDQLRDLYQNSSHELLRSTGVSSLDLSKMLSDAGKSAGIKSSGDYVEGSTFANSMREIARLIKADVGLQFAFAESRTSLDGTAFWDTHSNMASMSGPFPKMADDFSKAVAAFWADLGDRAEDVVLVTHTDFGRTVIQNEGMGSDHGRATAMFVLGGNIKGGQVLGELPEVFDRDILEDGMDLPVTTDYRSVVGGVLKDHMGIQDLSQVFPNWHGKSLDLVRS